MYDLHHCSGQHIPPALSTYTQLVRVGLHTSFQMTDVQETRTLLQGPMEPRVTLCVERNTINTVMYLSIAGEVNPNQ